MLFVGIPLPGTGAWTGCLIAALLNMDKKKAFLSFAYGVWVTAWARAALWSCLIELDPYVIYADTDSLKLLPGYDKNIIKRYNRKILNETRAVCKRLGYKYSDFAPEDIKGKKHPMGVFEYEETYKKNNQTSSTSFALSAHILFTQENNMYSFFCKCFSEIPPVSI